MAREMERSNKKIHDICISTGIAALLGFAVILCFVLQGKTGGFDDPIRMFFYNMRSAWLNPLISGFTRLGNWQCITALCIALLAIPTVRKTYGIPTAAMAIFVSLLNKVIKIIVQRPRPDDIFWLVPQGGYSFSSGHSITSLAVFGLLLYLVRRQVKNRTLRNALSAVLVLMMFGIGLSRIYVGVHYPTDVLAGWCLGWASLTGAVCIMQR